PALREPIPPMRAIILRRLLIAVPILLGLATVNFVLIHSAPGDPVDLLLGQELEPEAREHIRSAWGLDEPLAVQYVRYLESVFLRFDLGYSIRSGRAVADEILAALPNTLQLAAAALLLQLGIGVALGVLSAVRQNSPLDRAARIGSLTVYSVPSFYLGLILLFLFAGGIDALRILPASGMVDTVNHDWMSPLGKIGDRLSHLVLPSLTLGLGGAASISRYVRGEMLDSMRQDYIRTARAKGLPESRVIWKHGFRNALIPIVTLLGLSLPFLFSGSVIVENVFGWPGMGRIAVKAAFGRDYPLFLGINLAFACMVVAGSLLADILYAIVDPRVRFD
ncbi:MAG: ABC transporter permease, partial [Planctomycetes bacterium]|nr:ABC transporter permease [Planctomycetota bacterium]